MKAQQDPSREHPGGVFACQTVRMNLEPQHGDAPSCVHAACPGIYIDDMFNDRVRCSCHCHRAPGSLLTRALRALARIPA